MAERIGPLNVLAVETIQRRWPGVWERVTAAAAGSPAVRAVEAGRSLEINGIRLASAYNPWREAELQAGRVPAESRQIVVYGLATGDLPRLLLQRPGLQSLLIVVLNAAVFKYLVQHTPCEDIFTDPRVELKLAADIHALHTPFATTPSCLALAEASAKGLAEKVFVELAGEYNQTRYRDDRSWIADQLKANEGLLRVDADVDRLIEQNRVQTACVVGAGPSLARVMDWLKAQKNAYIIATDAALKPLLAKSIVPDVVVSIDPSGVHVGRHLDIANTLAQGIALVYFPVVSGAVLAAWPGPRYAAYPRHPLYHDVSGRIPKGELYASGSVLHPAVDLAVKMGAVEVYLLGADFAFPRGQTHVAGASFNRAIEGSGSLPGVYTVVTNGHGQPVRTQSSFLAYLAELENYISVHRGVRFINTSRDGAVIKGAVYADAAP